MTPLMYVLVTILGVFIGMYMHMYIHDRKLWNKGYCPYCGTKLYVEHRDSSRWKVELHCGKHGFLGFVHIWSIHED